MITRIRVPPSYYWSRKNDKNSHLGGSDKQMTWLYVWASRNSGFDTFKGEIKAESDKERKLHISSQTDE